MLLGKSSMDPSHIMSVSGPDDWMREANVSQCHDITVNFWSVLLSMTTYSKELEAHMSCG